MKILTIYVGSQNIVASILFTKTMEINFPSNITRKLNRQKCSILSFIQRKCLSQKATSSNQNRRYSQKKVSWPGYRSLSKWIMLYRWVFTIDDFVIFLVLPQRLLFCYSISYFMFLILYIWMCLHKKKFYIWKMST